MNTAIDYLVKADPVLAPWIRSLPACDLVARNDLFACLAEAIVSQLVSTAAAKTLVSRVREVVGSPLVAKNLASTPAPALRACGLSNAKALCLIESARQVSTGALNLKKLAHRPEAEIMAELTAIRGIGPWTAEMLMIFGMRKLDVLPIKDLGLRHGLAKLYALESIPQPRECISLTESWRPFRSVGTWYLWRIKDSTK